MISSVRRLWYDATRRVSLDRLRPFWMPGLMMLAVALLLIGLLSWQLPYGNLLLLRTGEIASVTVVAPRGLTYESALLTEQMRERAAQQVPEQFDNQELLVRRSQVRSAREILPAMTAIRDAAGGSLVERTDQLLAIPALDLDAEAAVKVLSLTDEQWARVLVEVPVVLDRVMRDEIREDTLSAARRQIPMFVSSTLDDEEIDVVVALVSNLVRPNSVLNQERTAALREAAQQEVLPVSVTLAEGETVIRVGDKATALQAEALTALSQLQTEWDPWTTLRAALLALLLIGIVVASILRLQPAILHNPRQLGLLLVVTVVWLLAAKFLIVNHPLLPYIYSLAALGMLVAVLCSLQLAMIFSFVFTVLILYLLPNEPIVAAYQALGALVGMLVVGRAERLIGFLWAGLVVALTNVAVVLIFRAPLTSVGTSYAAQLLFTAALSGGLAAAIALIGYFALGNLFGITTPLQLTELSRPTHPLLRQLLLKASGTYHHTILVSNMAERAAAAIGADAMLVRVGAYYHDIGKTVRPYFFAENILDDTSPHDKLDPLTSAKIIISHVTDGVDLAQKYKLPAQIQEFIQEHHGRTLVKYFYSQAQQQASPGEEVNERDFRYPGPNPRTKETAILMLADTCEAAVRAVRPATREELEALVDRLIDERVANGELSDSDLTFRELTAIKEIFLHVLQGVHHPRIQYPGTTEDSAERPRERTAGAWVPAETPALPAGAPAAERRLPGGVEDSRVSTAA
jgi:hypothetical protein